FYFFFFFSSRRRHTRSLRDWSSDVCSSDLLARIHLIGPRRKSAQNVVDVTQILSVRHKVNPCKLHVIFKPIEPEKTFNFRNRQRSEERRVGKEGKSRWGEGE